MFIPTTIQEVKKRGWNRLDIIIVSGDTYIDSPFIGAALIGHVLMDKGYRVGMIAQPDVSSDKDITRLGEPQLFWGITGGCVDSMVANYTALNKWRKKDDYTPGGLNSRRPDRAVIVYANLVRQYFKHTVPIVLGGVEASLRRIAHYDYASNKIRRSILFDAKADYLLFGMAHHSAVELASALKQSNPPHHIRGLAYISKTGKGILLPSFESVTADKQKFIESFKRFYENSDPVIAETLCQEHNHRYVVLNPPAPYSTTRELDEIHALDFERQVHPWYQKDGRVNALDTIRFAIPTHYGCYGECNFCAISMHQGHTVRSRSEASILKEARIISKMEGFKGYITDLGGPTANMYGFECKKKQEKGKCPDRRCLFPTVCIPLKPDHSRQVRLIRKIEALPGVKKVFISSGIRYDLLLADQKHGAAYLKKVVQDNVSGQMKVAPEHTQAHVLNLMGKQDISRLLEFKNKFDKLSQKSGKKQFLTYYLMAAHPGCGQADMKALKKFAVEKLHLLPEQVQIFTPTPSTWSTVMYYTGINPFNNKPVFVEKHPKGKARQKAALAKPGKQKNSAGRRVIK